MRAICKDLDNKNCSLKNEIKTIKEEEYFICEECGGELTISNSFVKILFSFLALLLIGGGVYFYIDRNKDTPPIVKKELKSDNSTDTVLAPFSSSKKEEEDTTPPKKPIIMSDISKVFYSDSFSLELEGEVDSRVYINNEDMGSVGKNGKIIFPLDISKTDEFEIFLEDNSANKNRSEPMEFSITKKDLKKLITEEGINFAFVSHSKQEVSYFLDPYIKYSDEKLSIYSKGYIELDKPIYVQTTPVTIKQFEKFINENSSYTPDGIKNGKLWNYKAKTALGDYYNENYPVANVSLKDIEKYIEWFNKKTGYTHRLPTVKEWIMTINQNLVDTELNTRRQKVDTTRKKVGQFIGNLFEFSSSHDTCGNDSVLLLGNQYGVDTKNMGKKICEGKLSKFITFRLVREK